VEILPSVVFSRLFRPLIARKIFCTKVLRIPL
jgi:hypothetical protein